MAKVTVRNRNPEVSAPLDQTGTAATPENFPGVDGRQLPNRLWFEPPYPGCRARDEDDEVCIVVGHWTGGESNYPTDDRDAERLVSVLRNRHNRKGIPEPLSIHANIGGFGRIVRLADELKTVTYHAGKVNPRAIGIEFTNLGTFAAKRSERPRPLLKAIVHGREVEFLGATPEQIRSWVRLCTWYASQFGIPKIVPGDEKTGGLCLDVLPPKRAAAYKGFSEHLHWSSDKADHGGQLMQALLDAGWKLG